MSATSALENNEDLENVPLVRMEDVQPDRSSEVINSPRMSCVNDVDDGWVINDDEDSNIGSMVSIQSEEVVNCQEDVSDNGELIVPEVLVPPLNGIQISAVCDHILEGPRHYIRFDRPQILAKEHRFLPRMICEAIEIKKLPNFNREGGWIVPPAWDPVINKIKTKPKHTTARLQDTDLKKPKPKVPESWPTLEILPGGVIKNADRYENELTSIRPTVTDKNKNEVGEMMYVCAKCSESFDNLILLVKHVRWHEEERKKEKDLARMKLQSIQTCKRKLVSELKTKCKVPKKS